MRNFSATKVAGNRQLIYAEFLRENSDFLPRILVPIWRYYLLSSKLSFARLYIEFKGELICARIFIMCQRQAKRLKYLSTEIS